MSLSTQMKLTRELFVNKLLLSILLFFLSPSVHASYFQAKNFNVALGLQYDSLLQKRGIITYEGFQVLPIYSVSLFNPNLLLAGSSLYWFLPIKKDVSRFLFRLNADSTGDEPLYYTEEEEDERVRRETTSEFDLFYEHQLFSWFNARLEISQDIQAHSGLYAEIQTRLSFFEFSVSRKANIRPNLFFSAGGGSQDHNEYLYGENSGDGEVTNIQYGLFLTSPKVIDPFWPTLKVVRFELVGDARGGSFVREKDGWQYELLFAFQVF